MISLLRATLGAAALACTCAHAASEIPAHEIEQAAHQGGWIGYGLSMLAVALVAVNLFIEWHHRREVQKDVSYDHLDGAYQDLYSVASRNPQVLNPDKTWSIDRMVQGERQLYEAYAWKVWVVCETIFDQTRSHPEVWNTWKTAIDIEARLHLPWMLREITLRPDSFKPPFKNWLIEQYGSSAMLRRLRLRARGRYASLRVAVPDDMGAIMALEELGFAAAIREHQATFEERLAAFPDGFHVLTLPGETAPLGYICAEIWREIPALGDHERYRLGHSPRSVHSPEGDTLYISSQTVHPHFQGAALGEFMFRRCIEEISDMHPDLKRCVLIVNEEWSVARSIYVRCGFEMRETIAGFFVDASGIGRAAEIMERPLPLDWANDESRARQRSGKPARPGARSPAS